MAFDGITVSALCHELNNSLSEGRVNKIAQPENDELILTIKTLQGQVRLLISAWPLPERNSIISLIFSSYCALST